MASSLVKVTSERGLIELYLGTSQSYIWVAVHPSLIHLFCSTLDHQLKWKPFPVSHLLLLLACDNQRLRCCCTLAYSETTKITEQFKTTSEKTISSQLVLLFLLLLERLSTVCHKTKTKANSFANQKLRSYRCSWRRAREKCANESRLVLASLLIGWQSSASFFTPITTSITWRTVKQIQSKYESLLTHMWKPPLSTELQITILQAIGDLIPIDYLTYKLKCTAKK